jgi:ATP phosphoribosyltransferase
MNNEVGKMWKVAVTYFKVLPKYFSGKSKKKTQISTRIVDISGQKETHDLMNMKQKF